MCVSCVLCWLCAISLSPIRKCENGYAMHFGDMRYTTMDMPACNTLLTSFFLVKNVYNAVVLWQLKNKRYVKIQALDGKKNIGV